MVYTADVGSEPEVGTSIVSARVKADT